MMPVTKTQRKKAETKTRKKILDNKVRSVKRKINKLRLNNNKVVHCSDNSCEADVVGDDDINGDDDYVDNHINGDDDDVGNHINGDDDDDDDDDSTVNDDQDDDRKERFESENEESDNDESENEGENDYGDNSNDGVDNGNAEVAVIMVNNFNYKELISNFSSINYSNFKIKDIISNMINIVCSEKNDENKAQELFRDSTHSSADFNNFISSFSFTKIEETKLLRGLHTFFPFANLPVRETSTHKIVSTLDHDTKRLHPIDCCMNGCMVFIDNSYKCGICGTDRFTPSNLSFDKRTPIKRLFLLPITPKIIQLIRTDDFLKLLNYSRVKYSENDNCYSDVQDGELYRESLNSMKEKYKIHEKRFDDGLKCVEVSLCLSMFYDGMMLYKSSEANFNPVGFTILNLPPTHRHEYGTGMFCGGIMTSKCGDNVEKFFLIHCLAEELNMLDEGVNVVFGDTRYIIHAQVISYDLDLKALEKIMCMEQCNSLHGCIKCRDFSGVKDVEQDRVILKGTTAYLPDDNWLRFIGRTGKCCPLGYYGYGIDDNMLEKYIERDIDAPNIADLFKKHHFPLHKEWKFVISCSGQKFFDKLSGKLPDDCYTSQQIYVVQQLNKKCYVKMEAWFTHYANGACWPYSISYTDAYVTGTVDSIYDLQFTSVTVRIPVFRLFYTLTVNSKFLVFGSEELSMDKKNEITLEKYKKYEPNEYSNMSTNYVHYFNNKQQARDIIITGDTGPTHVHSWLDDAKWMSRISAIADSQYCDHRPQKQFSLLDHNSYLEYGSVAINQRTAIKQRNGAKTKNATEKAYKGVKGLSPLCLCPYFRFDNISYESTHTLKNVMYNILQHLSGEIKVTQAFFTLAQKYNMFDIKEKTNSKNGKKLFSAPWAISPTSQHKADSLINSMMLPSGYKDYGVSYIFQKTGSSF